MEFLVLLTAVILLACFILTLLSNYTIPLPIGLSAGCFIVLLYLLIKHIDVHFRNHVSQKQQTAILLYFENTVTNSPELQKLYIKANNIAVKNPDNTIRELALRLSLPRPDELKGSIFCNYYKCFYLCPETLALLYTYKEKPVGIPLYHPLNDKMIRLYNPLSQKDESI